MIFVLAAGLGMVEVYGLELITAEEFISRIEQLSSYLPESSRNRTMRFVRSEDKQRALMGELMVRSFLSNRLNLSNRKIKFKKNRFGKPYLKSSTRVYFNISHSGKWIVSAFSSKPVGIDIEKLKPVDFKLARRFFSQEENKDLLKKNVTERQAFFFELWSLKESYLKAKGIGITVALSSFTIKTGKNSIIVKNDKSQNDDLFFKQYDIDEGYRMAVCAYENNFVEKVMIKELNELVAGLGKIHSM